MAKLLTNREMELFKRIVYLAEQLYNANPEVGMGPSRLSLAKKQAETLSFEIDEDDIEEVSEEVGGS